MHNKPNRIFYLALVCVFLLFFGCEQSIDYKLKIVNKSGKGLYAGYVEERYKIDSLISKDPDIWPNSARIDPDETQSIASMGQWEDCINNNPDEKIYFYTISLNLMREFKHGQLRKEDLRYHVYSFTVPELEKLNWVIELKDTI